MDMRWIYGNALEELAQKRINGIVPYIQEQVIAELREEYPDYVPVDAISLPSVLSNINNRTDKQFVIIIDEWDCIFRQKDTTASRAARLLIQNSGKTIPSRYSTP